MRWCQLLWGQGGSLWGREWHEPFKQMNILGEKRTAVASGKRNLTNEKGANKSNEHGKQATTKTDVDKKEHSTQKRKSKGRKEKAKWIRARARIYNYRSRCWMAVVGKRCVSRTSILKKECTVFPKGLN